jgi:hypothetical protein
VLRYSPTQRSRLVNGAVLVGILALLAYVGVRAAEGGTWWVIPLLVATAALFWLGMGPHFYSFVEVGPDAIRVGSSRRTRTIPWASVASCIYATNRGRSEDVILELHSGKRVALAVLEIPAISDREWKLMEPVRERIEQECAAREIPIVREFE